VKEGTVRVFLVVEKFVDFVYVLPNFGKIQRAEIFEEPLIHKILNLVGPTLSMLKKKALSISLGGATSAR